VAWAARLPGIILLEMLGQLLKVLSALLLVKNFRILLT
jgi:hypothetical protein